MNVIAKIAFFLNKAERKKLLLIFIAITMTGMIEMGVVAAILPFMAVVAKPDIIHTHDYIAKVYQALAFTEPKYFMLFLGGGLFCFLILGNAFSALTSWMTLRFCYRQGKKISCALLEKYLSQSYVFFLHRSSSDLAKNVIAEVDRMIMGILISGLQCLAKLVMIFSIFTLLVIVDAVLAFSILGILGGVYTLVFLSIRKKIMRAGKSASTLTSMRLQLLYEVMGSIKELKIVGRESFFLQKLEAYATAFAKAEVISQLSPLITRYIVEAIAFGGMLLIALYLICAEQDIAKFFPLLALYALAGYRLMPAMQQLFAALTSFKYHHSALDIIYTEMQLPMNKGGSNTRAIPFEKSVALHQVEYSYPQTQKKILNAIDFHIKKHSTIGIVGTSGAGKTTILDIILGLLQPTHGKLLVDDTQIKEENLKNWQAHIGYVPQNIFLLDTSIAQNIALGIEQENIDMEKVVHAARLANLHEFIQRDLPKGYQTTIGERGIRLSGGQRQRIGIARALYHDPDLLIFDEATSALDGVTEKVILEAIKNLGRSKTIILVAHRLNTVKDCDVIYVLNQGEIVGKGKYTDLYETNLTFQHLVKGHLIGEEIPEIV